MELLPLGLAFVAGVTGGVLVLHQIVRKAKVVEFEALPGRSTASRGPTRENPTSETPSAVKEQISGLEQQALSLYHNYNELQDHIQEIQANLAEIREQATYRFTNEVEKLQDQNELLFTTWSEGFREEIEEAQHRIEEHIQGDQMAFEIRLDRTESLLTSLTLQVDQLSQIKEQPGPAHIPVETSFGELFSPTVSIFQTEQDLAPAAAQQGSTSVLSTQQSSGVQPLSSVEPKMSLTERRRRFEGTAANGSANGVQQLRKKTSWNKITGSVKGLAKWKPAAI